MSLRLEATEQEKQVLVYVHGAALNLTKNRRTILAVFLAGTQPVKIIELWLQAKKADRSGGSRHRAVRLHVSTFSTFRLRQG
jgi:hypothetical protein